MVIITQANIKKRTKLVDAYNRCKSKNCKNKRWADIKMFEEEMDKLGQNG